MRQSARQDPTPAAFTLVELLVVISVITLLMAVLLPVLGKARGAAKASMCGSNLRQIGVAAQTYSNEFTPWACPPMIAPNLGSASGWYAWQYTFHHNYLNGVKTVLECPALDVTDLFQPSGYTNQPWGNALQGNSASYVMNGIELGNWTGATITPYTKATSSGWCGRNPTNGNPDAATPIRRDDVLIPSTTIYIADSVAGITYSDAETIDQYSETDHGVVGGAGDRDVGFQHGTNREADGSFNLLFGDGHVELRNKTTDIQWAAIRK